jgi:hypothetical protein
MRGILGFVLIGLAGAWGAEPLLAPNASVWVTDAMKASQSLRESTARAPKDLLTVAEKSDWKETGNYDEAVNFYRQLAARSPYARLVDLGATPQGRRMYALIASKDKAFAQAEVRATGKPVLLLQNGIHPGENGGKDAAMMLLRDILVTKKYESFLDHMVILSIPVFNIDGHENSSPYHRFNEQGPAAMGFRATAQRLNLNRDYMKADAPEMQNWLRFYNRYQPDMHIDNHVTDGADLQHDCTIAIHDGIDIHPQVGAWVKGYTAKMWKAMDDQGHVMGWYVGGPMRSGGNFVMMPASPRLSTGYAAARNRVALLVETHSLKPFAVRAWAHFDIMVESMKLLVSNGKELKAATTAADKDVLRPGAKLAIDYAPAKTGIPYSVKGLETETYTGTALGGPVLRYLPKAKGINVTLIRDAVGRTEVTVPAGYYVPREWTNVLDLLRLHGVQVRPLTSSASGKVEVTRFGKVSFAPLPFESRFAPSFETMSSLEERKIEAGRYFFVPAAQTLGKLVMNLLEPEAPDSVVKWGTMNSIFELKEYASDYILEPFAQKMLAQDSKLKADFEAALAADPAMAKNPRARAMWLYMRSPYYEKDKDLYPILKLLP